jgi:hypothetical protein
MTFGGKKHPQNVTQPVNHRAEKQDAEGATYATQTADGVGDAILKQYKRP